MTSQYNIDPLNGAIRLMQRAWSQGPQRIVANHKNIWANLWKNDIVIKGNKKDQKSIRNILYHFYSFINPTIPYGLSPMGLSGLGYNGHVFWDMDLWMYPGILVMNPNLAKKLI